MDHFQFLSLSPSISPRKSMLSSRAFLRCVLFFSTVFVYKIILFPMDSVIFFVSFISISAGAYVHVCVCSLLGEILHFSCDRVHFSGLVERIVVFFFAVNSYFFILRINFMLFLET